MYLIAMHQIEEYPTFIEGFHEKYECITLWNGAADLMAAGQPFFTYTTDTRIKKYTHPFR